MDGREGMAVSGSAAFYLSRGFGDTGLGFSSASGGGSVTPIGFSASHGYKPFSNPNTSIHTNVRDNNLLGSTFQVQNPAPNFVSGINSYVNSVIPSNDTVRKKRGRPRKYAPDGGGANMSLGLSPMSSKPSHNSVTVSQKPRGRPRGSGWKQKLAPLGEWMNSSAGLAFSPHIIHVRVGEDVAEKVLSFAQQRPRALCVLSANGTVSLVNLRQPSGSILSYEGRFDILCLSGSYLVNEGGGSCNRIGGLSISVCSPDGHAIGGAIGGRITAVSPVRVVVCSFVYSGPIPKVMDTTAGNTEGDRNLVNQHVEKSSSTHGAHGQNLSPNPLMSIWPPGPQQHPHREIDLTRG